VKKKRVKNTKHSDNQWIKEGFPCPGLDSLRPGIQYLISSVCQNWVMNFKFNRNVEFNIHFLTLLFVFKTNIYYSIGLEKTVIVIVVYSIPVLQTEYTVHKPYFLYYIEAYALIWRQ
jgi:hypothetical protein